LQIRSIVHN